MAMFSNRNLNRALASLVVAGSVALASGACLAADAHSIAAGVHADLAYRGQSIRVAAGHLSGRKSGAYDTAVAVNDFHEEKSGAPVVLAPHIAAAANLIAAHVASSGVTLDEISSQADVSVADGKAVLLINPPPVAGARSTAAPQPAVPLLTLTAHEVTSVAYYTRVYPKGITAGGTASIDRLKLTGSVFGSQPINYSGTPAPNTVIFDSPALTVTLNKQVAPSLSGCSHCARRPVSIEVVAVDILLKRVVSYGRAVTGEVRLGTSFAQ